MRTVVVLKCISFKNVRNVRTSQMARLFIPVKRSLKRTVEVVKTVGVVLRCVDVKKKSQKKCWINYRYFLTLLKNKGCWKTLVPTGSYSFSFSHYTDILSPTSTVLNS